eukprot:8472839-Ditylum_brightwellii.AAC.1
MQCLVLKSPHIEPNLTKCWRHPFGTSSVVTTALCQSFNGKEPCKSINSNDSVDYGATVQTAIFSRADKSEKLSEILSLDVHGCYVAEEFQYLQK